MSDGDTITMHLKLRFDGTINVNGASYPINNDAYADIRAGLSVHDAQGGQWIDYGSDGVGWSNPAIATFGATNHMEVYDVYQPYWKYSYQSSWSESWQTESNITQYVSSNHSDQVRETFEGYHYSSGHLFDTGPITLDFQAVVGHTLEFSADLYAYISAAGDSEIFADFGNTFAFNLTSDTPGLGMDWQVALVPEPLSAMILMPGSAALLLRRRV